MWKKLLPFAIAALATACVPKSRFATCEADADCKAKDADRPYCINLRCVECAYDRHCKKKGGACDLKNNNCVPVK